MGSCLSNTDNVVSPEVQDFDKNERDTLQKLLISRKLHTIRETNTQIRFMFESGHNRGVLKRNFDPLIRWLAYQKTVEDNYVSNRNYKLLFECRVRLNV